MKNHFADHLEKQVASALIISGIKFIHESQNKEQRLDFFLPEINVYIEVKQFHTHRIEGQIASQENVIVLQGKGAIDFFCKSLIRLSTKTIL